METPVLYFYSTVDRQVDVSVQFRRGVITDWYPQAAVTPRALGPRALTSSSLEGSIVWAHVTISPRAEATYPSGHYANHYFAARQTDAAPVLVGNEREKFLFYRGVANFALPLTARLTSDGAVTVNPANGQNVGDLFLFENRDGVVRFAFARRNSGETSMNLPADTSNRQAMSRALEKILVKRGLYQKEAAAMVATWRDSWFEDGLRLFYVVPRAAIDDVLPLEISPAPRSIERVFVGRVELITPRSVDEVRTAMRNRDRAPIVKYGRFLRAIASRLTVGAGTPQWKADMQFAFSTVAPPAGGCR